jgi:adenosylcobinamide-GDP ribazoletransferase
LPVLGFGRILFAAGFTLLPVIVTGGIHLDGFCDTTDALAAMPPPSVGVRF